MLAAVEDVAVAAGLGPQRLAGALGGEDAPRPGLGGATRLVEDRERVEVRLERAGHREVDGRDARQGRPEVRGAAGARDGQLRADHPGEVESGGHVAAGLDRAVDEVGELVLLVVARLAEQDGPAVRHGRHAPSAAARRTA